MSNQYFIVQLGVGGNGGAIAQAVAQMLATQASKKSVYVLADPDLVELKNIANQLFVEDDIGYPKAEILANRYGYAYDITMLSNTTGYIETVADIQKLFEYNDYSYLDVSGVTCILIGSVDNNYTRQVMHEFFTKTKNCIYIDVGNESCVVPVDFLTRPKNQWTKEETEAYENSGWSGQMVIGQRKYGETKFPPVAEVYPDILEDTDEIKPSALSCAELTASEPQRFITNRFAATAVLGALQLIMLTGEVPYHLVHFHAQRGYMRSVPLLKDDELLNWTIMGDAA